MHSALLTRGLLLASPALARALRRFMNWLSARDQRIEGDLQLQVALWLEEDG